MAFSELYVLLILLGIARNDFVLCLLAYKTIVIILSIYRQSQIAYNT